jgi:hypothetical protein
VLRTLAVDDVLAFRSSQAALDRLPQLKRTAAVGDVVVYRVLSRPDRAAARPSDAPGYHCVATPP